MTLVAVIWPVPALPGSVWGSHRTCTTGRHVGEKKREVCQFSCCETAGSLSVPDRNYSNMLFHALAWYFFLECFIKEEKLALNFWSGYDIVFSESSLSLQCTSSLLIAAVSLACAETCLCTRSLACVTLFPLPVQPMLIITPVFQTPLFQGGGVCLRFSKCISPYLPGWLR